MAHEKSITTQRTFPKLGTRWVNLDNSGPNKGATLGPRTGFSTRVAAEKAARKRSQAFRPGKKQPTAR